MFYYRKVLFGEKWLGNRGVVFGIGLGVGFRTFWD
jgi:hypothetical protein